MLGSLKIENDGMENNFVQLLI